jgi:YD repeat-containing protein
VEVAYSDNSTLQIAYYGRDQLENVKSVRERDGTLTSYAYKQNGESQLAVDVNVKNKEGKLLTQSRYEYTFKNRADGEEWTQRLVSTVDGYKTDTIYHEKFGLPVVIRSGEDETRFQYDPKGRVVEKVTPYEVTKLKYNDQVGKVSRVEKLERSKGAKANWSEFQYDSQGNLTIARNSEGKGVKLVYERSGKIAAMIDQSKRQLTFKYDANAKPIEIRDSKLGAITVQYNNAGEVLKVDSAGGRKVAQEVSMAFQNLLDIIRPAGVSLSI